VTTFENPWELQKFQFHSVLTRGFSQFPCDARLVNELPWQLKTAADVSGLKATLARPEVFVKMWSNIKDLRFVVDFLNYWKFLTREECDVVETYSSMLDEIARSLEETGVKTSTQDTSDTGDLVHAENHGIANRILRKKHGSNYAPIEVAYVAYLTGIYFLGLQEFESAETTLQRALKLSRDVTSIDDVDFLCQVHKSLGDLYFDWRKLDKAVGYYEGVLKTAVEVSRYVNMDEVGFVYLLLLSEV
jgi:tetratricopeptide (TPR) repeat protein